MTQSGLTTDKCCNYLNPRPWSTDRFRRASRHAWLHPWDYYSLLITMNLMLMLIIILVDVFLQ